jgi:hypothetical protein
MNKFSKLVNQILNEYSLEPDHSEQHITEDEVAETLLSLDGGDGRVSLEIIMKLLGFSSLETNPGHRGTSPTRKLKNRLVFLLQDYAQRHPEEADDIKNINSDQIYIGTENDGTQYVQIND